MDKRKRLNSVGSSHDLEDLDERPASSMSVEKDLGDSDEKVDIEGPATPAPFLRPPRSQSPFLIPPSTPVKAEAEEQTSLVSPLVSSATSALPTPDSREATAKLMSPPVSSSSATPGGGRVGGGVGNIHILPHEPSIPSPHATCLSPYSTHLQSTNSIPYPYLYYSQFMHPLYLGRTPGLPQLATLAPPSATSMLDKAARDAYSSYPYLRPPHHPPLLGGPPRPVPIHSYSYAIPQVPANL